ncbi:MAG: energy transducer TonB [Mangrovibacterium sp.]
MVKKFFIVFLLFTVSNGYAQRDTGIYKMGYIFETGPLFKGGEEALREFVEELIIYPLSAIKDSLEGKVYVTYIIDTLGFTREHYIEKGIRDDLNKEALRVAQLIKYEKPAMLKGKPILFYETIPIKFKLPNNIKQNKKCSKQDSIMDKTCPCPNVPSP